MQPRVLGLRRSRHRYHQTEKKKEKQLGPKVVRRYYLFVNVLLSKPAFAFAFVLLCVNLLFAQEKLITADPDLVRGGDIVDVDVIGSFEFDWRGGLTPEGFLDGYDKVADRIPAACRTERQIAAAIEDALRPILRRPEVSVHVVDRSQRPFAILLGAVRNPYRFRLNRSIRLNELIALSGGITDNSSGVIEIFRSADANCTAADRSNGQERVNISVSDLLAGNEDANPVIVSGDLINVLSADPVYVIGGVTNPGQIKFSSGLTLDRAVAISGGVVRKKITGKAKVYRRSETGMQETIETDLSAVGDTPSEIELKPFDIVEVIERGSGERRFPTSGVDGSANRDAAPVPIRTVD